MWISLAAFVVFSAVAGAGWTYRADLSLVLAAQEWSSATLDRVGNLFSEIGDWEVSGAFMLLIVAAMIFSGHRRIAWRLLFVFVVTGLVELALKMALPVTPIPEYLSRSDGFAPLVAVEYSYPYPSGHLLRTVIVLGAVYLWTRSRLLGVVFALGVGGMALTRVYLGVHWPSDVIGGALLGLAGLLWAFRKGKG